MRDRALIRGADEIARIRDAALVVHDILAEIERLVAPGLTTAEIDRLAEARLVERGARPAFKGYHGFPACICISVNDEVVHGIPGERVLADGDVVSIDCGAIVDGWHGDAAITVAVGEVSPAVRELMAVTEDALWHGIAAARLGGRVTDISAAVEAHVRGRGPFGILEDYVGHGIGSAMHQPPNVPNVGRAGRGPKLVAGLALAVEPMVTLGTHETQLLEDDWTVVTSDSSLAAHFEHTFTLTPDGAWVLTALDGGESRLAELGVPFGGRRDS